MNKKKLFIVVNVDKFFLSHRLPIALEGIKRGWDVYVLAANTGKKEEIEKHDIKFIEIPFHRSGTNPFHESYCIILLHRYYKKYKPDIIHHVTLKASILGSLAAKLSQNKNVVNAISGFGYNFTSGRNGILQRAIRSSIKLAFKTKYFHFILQNPSDIKELESFNVGSSNNLHLIKGSGVDLNEFSYSEPPKSKKIKILFPARMLLDKGIIEVIDAMTKLQPTWESQITLILAGGCDNDNKAAISEDNLKKMLIPEYIEWIGFREDMIDQYRNADIVVLPSYREGLPKSLIEACAIGRPIVTTDVPGCRECVIDTYNGYIVPPKTSEPLADAIEKLCKDKTLRQIMGRNSREIAEKDFSINSVISKTFSIYNTITKEK